MQTIIIAITIFLLGYLLNIFYITVLYHRALAHNAIVMGPKMNLQGLQNNHHAHLECAMFSIKAPELDLVYCLCLLGAKPDFYQIPKSSQCLKK
jgi:fatty-acid desaturase